MVMVRPLSPKDTEGLSGALAERLVSIQGGEVERSSTSLLVRIGEALKRSG